MNKFNKNLKTTDLTLDEINGLKTDYEYLKTINEYEAESFNLLCQFLCPESNFSKEPDFAPTSCLTTFNEQKASFLSALDFNSGKFVDFSQVIASTNDNLSKQFFSAETKIQLSLLKRDSQSSTQRLNILYLISKQSLISNINAYLQDLFETLELILDEKANSEHCSQSRTSEAKDPIPAKKAKLTSNSNDFSNDDGEEGEIIEEIDESELSPSEDLSDEIESDKELSSLQKLTELSYYDLKMITENLLPIVLECATQKTDNNLDPDLIKKLVWICLLCVCETWSIFPSLENKHCISAFEFLEAVNILFSLNLNLTTINENLVDAFQQSIKTFSALDANSSKQKTAKYASKLRSFAFRVVILYQIFMLHISRRYVAQMGIITSTRQYLNFNKDFLFDSASSNTRQIDSFLNDIFCIQQHFRTIKRESKSNSLRQLDSIFIIRDNATVTDSNLKRLLAEYGGSELQRSILLDLVINSLETSVSVLRWFDSLLPKLINSHTSHVFPLDQMTLLLLRFLISKRQPLSNEEMWKTNLKAILTVLLNTHIQPIKSCKINVDSNGFLKIPLFKDSILIILIHIILYQINASCNSHTSSIFYICILSQCDIENISFCDTSELKLECPINLPTDWSKHTKDNWLILKPLFMNALINGLVIDEVLICSLIEINKNQNFFSEAENDLFLNTCISIIESDQSYNQDWLKKVGNFIVENLEEILNLMR